MQRTLFKSSLSPNHDHCGAPGSSRIVASRKLFWFVVSSGVSLFWNSVRSGAV